MIIALVVMAYLLLRKLLLVEDTEANARFWLERATPIVRQTARIAQPKATIAVVEYPP